MITMLDPAHGGSAQRGKSSPQGKTLADNRAEKDLTLAIANRLASGLGPDGRLTRSGDENRSLGERIAAAHTARAGVFLSLHVHPAGSGGSVAWVHSRASEASLALAAALQRELDHTPTPLVDVRSGDLAVLAPDRHLAETAACLVELEFTSPDDLDTLAQALNRALRGHAARYGRGPVTLANRHAASANALGNEELVFGSTEEVLRYINDRAGRFGSWLVGIDNTRLFPFSAICQLVGYDAAGNVVTGGTGFYIGSDRLLTAGHVIVDGAAGIAFTQLEIRPGKNGTSQPNPSFSVTPAACFPHPNWFNKTTNSGSFSDDFDMAVIRVTTPPPYGIIFDELDDSLTSRSAVAICGYGRVETTTAGWVARERLHLDIDTIRTVNASINQASYDAFTEGGTSGSPVFYVESVDDPVAQVCRQSAVVVGVHTNGFHASMARTETQLNSCCLITPEKKLWILQDWSAYGRRVGVPAAPRRRMGSARALGDEDIVFSSEDAILAYIADRMRRQQNWTRGVDDTTHFPFSAICHLLMTDDGGTQYSGTGFYIARDRILTCGHNIHYDGLGTRSVVVTPGKNGSGASAGTPFTVAGSDCIIHPQWRSGSGYNRDFDLAVLRVTTPPPDNRWFPFLDDRGMSVAPVTVCGYAGETVDSEKQHLDIDMVRDLSPSGERADYAAATQQGSSGSPVFYVHGIEDEATQTSRYEVGIVGVHTSGNDAQGHSSADRNSCCLLTAAKTAWIRSLGGTYGRGGRVSIPVVNRSHRSAAPRLTLPGAHERYGRGDLVARAKEDGGYFTDADQLGAQLADTRLYDTRKVSTLADAYALIATFRSASGGAWPTLDRNAVADAMKIVIDTPESIQQGGLNLCGPASFLNMWAGRDPVAFVRFASALYNQGQASIGSMAVTPGSRMRNADYGALSTRLGGNLPDPASWMVMGSLRDDNNAILPYDGQHAEDLAGLTTPEELTDWMNATGIWTVRNEADWTHILPSRGIPHATGLYEYDGQDISLLINANMLAQSRQPIGHLDRNWILSQFPNHFVVLRNSPVVDVSDRTVHFRIWTWAGLFDVVVTQQVFLDNYYGAVIGRLR